MTVEKQLTGGFALTETREACSTCHKQKSFFHKYSDGTSECADCSREKGYHWSQPHKIQNDELKEKYGNK